MNLSHVILSSFFVILISGTLVSGKKGCAFKAIKNTFKEIRKGLRAHGHCGMFEGTLKGILSAPDVAVCNEDMLREHKLSGVVSLHLRIMTGRCQNLHIPDKLIQEVKQYRTPNIDPTVVNILLSDKKPDEASLAAVARYFDECSYILEQMLANPKKHNYCQATADLYACLERTYNPRNELARAWDTFVQTTQMHMQPPNSKNEECQLP